MRKEPKEILDEIKKCQESPYYFATTYLKVNKKPFTTPLSERQFNQYFLQGRMLADDNTDFRDTNRESQQEYLGHKKPNTA